MTGFHPGRPGSPANGSLGSEGHDMFAGFTRLPSSVSCTVSAGDTETSGSLRRDGSRIRRSDRVAFGSALRGLPGLDVVCSRNAWSAISGIDDASVNTAMLATAERADMDELLDRVGSAGVAAQLLLADDAILVAPEIESRGWRKVGVLPVMSLELGGDSRERTAENAWSVRRAERADLDEVSRILASAFDIDSSAAAVLARGTEASSESLQVWVLLEHGRVASTVSTGRVGDTLLIWAMATRPSMTRRGLGRTLLTDVLRRAHEDGADRALLTSSADGLKLYADLGFQIVESWQVFVN